MGERGRGIGGGGVKTRERAGCIGVCASTRAAPLKADRVCVRTQKGLARSGIREELSGTELGRRAGAHRRSLPRPRHRRCRARARTRSTPMPKGACTQQALHSAESSRQDDWAGGVEAHARSRQETPLAADSCRGHAGDAACGMQRGLCREDNSSRVLKNGKPERCESQVQRAATHHAKTLPKGCGDAWVW